MFYDLFVNLPMFFWRDSHVLFDLIQVKPTRVDEDADVDIMTTEKVAAFSDSDESEDGLYFLPTVPDRDASPPRPPPSPVPSPNTTSVPKVAGSMTPSNSAGSQDSDTEPDGQQTEQNSEGEIIHDSGFSPVELVNNSSFWSV